MLSAYARLNVGPDLNPNCLTWSGISENFLENSILKKKISRQQQRMQNYPAVRDNPFPHT